jgi:hypothetical protein
MNTRQLVHLAYQQIHSSDSLRQGTSLNTVDVTPEWVTAFSREMSKRLGYHPTQEVAAYFHYISGGKLRRAIKDAGDLWESATAEVADSHDDLADSIEDAFLDMIDL